MSALKIAIPMLIVSALIFLVPVLFIFGANDLEQNVAVTGTNAGVWTSFLQFNHVFALILSNGTFILAIALGIGALIIVLFGVMAMARRTLG